MSIRLRRLVVTGPQKEDAEVAFGQASHLVFGPTDTGKSYILACVNYCLGSGRRPPHVGVSEGYTSATLEISSDDSVFTIRRDFVQGTGAVYQGSSRVVEAEPLEADIAGFLLSLSRSTDRRILEKAGTLRNFSAGDLRYLSLYDEIKTLDTTNLIGKDPLQKIGHRAAIALALSGVDDSTTVLVPSTKQRNIAKGQAETTSADLKRLEGQLPKNLTKADAVEQVRRIQAQMDAVSVFLRSNSVELAALKARRGSIERNVSVVAHRIRSLREAEERFVLLDMKYGNDLDRLRSLSSAASVVPAFETRPCPLCGTDLAHQSHHAAVEQNHDALRIAARAEIEKIEALRIGLAKALRDVADDLGKEQQEAAALEDEARQIGLKQSELVRPLQLANTDLASLSSQRAALAVAIRDLDEVDRLRARLASVKPVAKRQVQKVQRDLSESASRVCLEVTQLLGRWGVPGVSAVGFDEEQADIRVNERDRTSFGKGKRAIFLMAYATALMERAVTNGYPHLGIVAIDSPVVTYKDPKHGGDDSEELLEMAVKDRVYEWLADRSGPGQVIVFENEEPDDRARTRLSLTEFVGHGRAGGRKGFFPD